MQGIIKTVDSFIWKKPTYSSKLFPKLSFYMNVKSPSHDFYVLSTKSDRNSDTYLQLTEEQNISVNTLGSDHQIGLKVHIKPPLLSETTARPMSKPGHLKKA